MEEHMTELDDRALLAAVERMQRENSRKSREAVLDLVISEARFLAPVEIGAPPESPAAGRTHLGAGTFVMSVPPDSLVPVLDGIMPVTVCSVVVFPAPLAPMRATISPSFTSKEIPFTAWIIP